MNKPEQSLQPTRALDDELSALEALLDVRERERADRADSADRGSPPPDKLEHKDHKP